MFDILLSINVATYAAAKIWKKKFKLCASEDKWFSARVSQHMMKFVSSLEDEAFVHFTLSDLCW